MDITTLNDENLDEFINNYRTALDDQLTAANEVAKQNRANAGAAIMGGANTAGMMYSNLPARSKIRYDTNTYYPTLASNQSSYQSGLDSLRSNAVSLYNQVKTYEDAIAEMDEKIAELNSA